MDVKIEGPAQSYYDRTTVEDALAIALEMIDEWDYAEDPHGYCHTRPTLVRLVEALEQRGVILPRTAYRERGGALTP